MNLRSLAFLCFGIGIGLAGCNGDDEGGDGGSGGSSGSGGSGSGGTVKIYCQVEDAGEIIGCDEHTIPSAAAQAARDACTADADASLVTTCPTANLIGKCSLVGGSLIFWQYTAGGATATEAEMDCVDSGGTWIPA